MIQPKVLLTISLVEKVLSSKLAFNLLLTFVF